MIIYSQTAFKDGGTIEFTTSDFKVFVDKRIGTIAKGSLWCGYPGGPNSRLLTESEIEEFWRALDTYKQYNRYIYDSCMFLFEIRGYKKPKERIRMTDTVCECGIGNGWRMSSDIGDGKVQCVHCLKIYPEFIYLRN